MKMKKYCTGLASALLALSVLAPQSANAATYLQEFTTNGNAWSNGGPGPYGLSPSPILPGSVTVDNSITDGSTFSAFNWVTGTKVWTLADIDRAFSSATFDTNGVLTYFKVVLVGGPSFATNLIETFGTLALDDGVGRNNCNGCVVLGDYTAVTSAVPEPATWAMFMLGFGLIGFSMRHRKRATGSVAVA